MKQLWKNYLDSFVSKEGAQEECAPASVAIASLGVAAIIVGVSFATETVGLDPLWVPLAFLAAGAVNSLTTYTVGLKRLNLWAFKQLLDCALYSLVFVSAAVFSKPPAAYGFLVILLASQQHYARQVGLNALAAAATILPPLAFALLFSDDVIIWSVVGVSGVIYLYTSKSTRQQMIQTRKALRAQSVLERIDDIVSTQRERTLSDERIGVAALFHELKNELGPAVWNIDFILDNQGNIPQRDQALGDLRASLLRSSEMVQSFYDLMKREEMEYPGKTLLTELPGALEQLGANDVAEDRTTVDFSSLPNLHVKGDISYLALALRNLVENAHEAGARNVTIDTQYSDKGAAVALTVRDDGPGLPEPVQKRLFEPFNTHGKETGTGLGIYLARRLIESSDGKLELIETGPEGTAFEAKLPIVNLSSNAKTPVDSAEKGQPSHEPLEAPQ